MGSATAWHKTWAEATFLGNLQDQLAKMRRRTVMGRSCGKPSRTSATKDKHLARMRSLTQPLFSAQMRRTGEAAAFSKNKIKRDDENSHVHRTGLFSYG